MTTKIYKALGPNVFVKEIKKETKIGDWVMPDSLDVDFTYGEVISCSEGYWEKGSFIPMEVQVGDNITFAKISGTKVTFNGEQLIRVFAADIVAKEIEGRILENDKEGE